MSSQSLVNRVDALVLQLITDRRQILPGLIAAIVMLSFGPSAAVAQSLLRRLAVDETHTLSLHPSATRGTLPLRWHQPDSGLKIGLVLSGGGARGFSQIGVMKIFEELHLPIHAIVGTSIGGMVGGLYASGYSAEDLDSIVRTTNWGELLGIGEEEQRSELFIDQKVENDRSLLTLRLDGFTPRLPEAISTGARMTQFIENLVWGSTYHSTGSFNELKYPFRAMATDLVAGRSIVLDSGNLGLALRATATVPLRFSPVAVDSMLLVDGGLLDNIPVHVARQMGCDIVIVVNTTSPLRPPGELLSPWNVADQVVTLMMQQKSQGELKAADFVITPNLEPFSGTDFSNPGGIIDSGEVAARRVKEALWDFLQRRRQRRKSFYNLGIECRDRDLLATLGLTDAPGMIGLDDLQQRLDEVNASGAYRDLAAQVVYTGDSAHVILTGHPGPMLDGIDIHGFSQISPQSYDRKLQSLAGQPLNFDSVTTAVEDLVRNVRRAGYSFFSIDSAQFNESTRHLDLYVEEGVIRSIKYVGLKDCAEFVVSRELEFKVGDLFQAHQAGAAVNRILRTGYFRQAGIEPIRMNGGGLEVVVNLKERSTGLLRFSANINSERYTRIGVELAEENLFGHGTHLGARFTGGVRDRAMSLDLRSNRIYGTYWTFGLIGYGSLRDVNLFSRSVDPTEGIIDRDRLGEYREMRAGAKLRFGRQMERLGQLSIEGRYERQGAQGRSANASDTRWHTISSLKLGTRFDTQDRIPYTRSGTLVDISYETAQHVLGADESFSKLSADGELYASIDSRNVIHPQLHLGFADATLPLMEQFSLGGQGSMFGLREDESRGRQLFLASLEYRYLLPIKIYFDTYVSLKYDIGATWLKPAEIRIAELEHGVGFSIGLNTPLGPADFALGRSFTFNKQPAPTFVNFGPVVAYFNFGYQLD